MPDLRQDILDYVSRSGYKPLKRKELAKKLKVRKQRLPDYHETVERLVTEGHLREGKNGKIRPAAGPGLMVGIIKRTAKGSGYLIPHEPIPDGAPRDIFISPRNLQDAHTGDEVLVKLLKRRGKGGQRTGRIEEILERATNTFVGTYFEEYGQGYVKVDGRTFHEAIYVGDPGAKGARPGDKVVIDMLRFPSHFQPGEAVLTKVLGPSGEPEVDTLSIIHEFNLPQEFPDDVHEEAKLQAQRFNERDLQGRRDLTKETIITIDPKEARDFDDAISLTRGKNGHWHLGVHIADVSHFVPPGGRLDEEAQRRGNSAYLPQQVIPMLPELISNGLASLQKGKVRYTKSVFIEFTPEGIPIHTELANTAVKVTRRFAYEEVMPVINDPEKYRTRLSAKIRTLLLHMHELAMILRGRRFAGGALGMDIPEVELELDRDGRVVGAYEVIHDESHQIIEEFMLAANMAVARRLSDKNVPYLRRNHGEPNFTKLQEFSRFVEALGYKLERYQSRPHLQELILKVRGTPHEYAVNYALLRSMQQAQYSPEELGHYALAVDHYCHFTSPIRRYPDLVVHRILDEVFLSRGKPHTPNPAELMKLGRHCSFTERRSASAERELKKIKLLRYMAKRVGEELDAVITGVQPFGFFCQGVEIPVEGLIHISWLSDRDYFYYDEDSLSLIGRKSGQQFRLGDRVRVTVARVDVDGRQIDFRVVPEKPKRGKKPPKKKTKKSRSQSGRAVDGSSSAPSKGPKTARNKGRKKGKGRRKRQ